MSIAEYIAERKKTKTYEEGLLIFKECNIESKWYGLRTVFPDLPNADDEYHVIVMNFKSVNPAITTVLTNKKPYIGYNDVKTNELDKYLFIFVKIKSQILSISSPADGYQLADGHTIHTNIDVEYKINNAEEFWIYADDPLALFQRVIINEAKKYFFRINSSYLVREIGSMKNDLESYINDRYNKDAKIKSIKDSLEENIKNECCVSGISIINVYSDIKLSSDLKGHLERIHKRIYSDSGILEKGYNLQEELILRIQIDKEIENDHTFYPYTLKQVVLALDTGLLENFYTLPRNEAMKKVHDEIRKKKNSYLSEHKKSKIEAMRSFIKMAIEDGFDEDQINMLRDKLIDEMQNAHENNTPLFTDQKFLQMILPSQGYIDDNTNPSIKEDPCEDYE